MLQEDYDELNEEDANDYMKALVVRTFAPMSVGSSNTDLDLAQEVQNYNSYLSFYQQSQESFIKCVRPLVEKMLGVRTFFEQNVAKRKSGVRPTLLVTNIKAEMLAKSTNIPRLITYLNTVNGKLDYDDTVWFGIYPNLALERKNDTKVTRKRFQGNEEQENPDINSLESLSRILDVCKDYRVQVFFSFESNFKCTFDFMATEGIEIYEERCRPLMDKPYSEFAIPRYPNPTIIPKDKSGVILDHKMVIKGENGDEVVELSKDQEDIAKLWIEGVYVGAAYLAAGTTAAWQDPEMLKERFRRNVTNQSPGVRFDIEANDHALKMETTMPKEITGFTASVKNDINTRNFGFVFSSDNAKNRKKKVNRITVYKARSLHMNHDLGTYEATYKTLHATYIDRILRFTSQDYKEDMVKRFFSNNPECQAELWRNDRELVNSILLPGDDLSYTVDDISNYCVVNIAYAGNIKNLMVELSHTLASVNAG